MADADQVRVLHCWEDGPRIERGPWDEIGSTCMLVDGHDGDHEFTPDSDIRIRFT